MRHDRRSAMITDEFVVEKPSFVEIKLTGDNIILYDYLLEQRFVLSPIAYEMFLEFDGIKSIRDIAIIIAQEYGEVLENIIHDVTDLVVRIYGKNYGICIYDNQYVSTDKPDYLWERVRIYNIRVRKISYCDSSKYSGNFFI